MTSLIPFRLQAVILSNLFIYEMLEELPEQTLVVNNIKVKNATAFVFHNFCINDSFFYVPVLALMYQTHFLIFIRECS